MKGMSRRRFLNRSLITAGAAGGLAAMGRSADAAAGANDKIRLGVIGTGGQGRTDMKAFFAANKNIDCAMICDVDDGMIAQTVKMLKDMDRREPESCKDWRKVIDNKELDVLLIATPDHWHALPTIHACQAGKDVYCEKPLANSIGEGAAMVEWAKKTNRIVQMGTQWRAGEHWAEAIDFVHSGKLGHISTVRCWTSLDWYHPLKPTPNEPVPAGVDYDMWLGPAPERPFNKGRFHFTFRWWWDYAGGLMTDWGVHLINIALWGMKADVPKRVSSFGGFYMTENPFGDAPDTQAAIYDFEDQKFLLSFEHHAGTDNAPEPQTNGIAFYGQNGKLVVNAGGWWVYPEKTKPGIVPEIAKVNTLPGEQCRVNLVKDFLNCVESRKQPIENIELGQHVTTVAALGNLALRTGRSIEYDMKNMKVIGNDEANEMITARYRDPWKLPKA